MTTSSKMTRIFGGRMVDISRLTAAEIEIEDIAQSLSRSCRFNGHVTQFYSIAQHCVCVSRIGKTPAERFWGLLHHAAAPYLGVLVPAAEAATTSVLPMRPTLAELRSRVLITVAGKFDLPWPIPAAVAVASRRMRYREALDLIPQFMAIEMADLADVEPIAFEGFVSGWTPSVAKDRFMARFIDVSTEWLERPKQAS